MTARERILEYIDFKGVSKYRFYKDVGLANGYLDKFGNMGSDICEKISFQYTDLSIEWLITGNGSMLKGNTENTPIQPISESKEAQETRPRIPLNAAAGSMTIALNGVTREDCEELPIIQAFRNYDFTILVNGDSMQPEFHSGDEIACVYLKQSSFIQWGRSHAIDTSQGIIVKRIYDDGDCILCKSEDCEMYKDFKIPKDEIYNLGLVIGMIRRY